MGRDRSAARGQHRVAVLGAGIQGVCVALCLAASGHEVVLVDQASDCLLRTSLRNEGKIHLGFTYAGDRSRRTARLMLDAALTFGPLLGSWLRDPIEWAALRSRPFTYLVMADSQLGRHELLGHYAALEAEYRERRGERRDYLGTEPSSLWREVPLPAFVSPERAVAAIETAEVSIDLEAFRVLLKRAIDREEKITTTYRIRVLGVADGGQGLTVSGRSAEGRDWDVQADAVVNCLWDGRLAVDRSFGLPLPDSWVYRLKYRVLGELPPALRGLPAVTMVLGPYGDIVPMGPRSYFSWYPASRRGWSSAVAPPDDWAAACRGSVEPELAAALTEQILTALDRVVPGVAHTRPTGVDAGIVVALGSSDIDEPDSRLHERHDVGVRRKDGYFSIDTGKLNCAPLFATQVVDQL